MTISNAAVVAGGGLGALAVLLVRRGGGHLETAITPLDLETAMRISSVALSWAEDRGDPTLADLMASKLLRTRRLRLKLEGMTSRG